MARERAWQRTSHGERKRMANVYWEPKDKKPRGSRASGRAMETRDEGVDRGVTRLRHGGWTSGLEVMTHRSGPGTPC